VVGIAERRGGKGRVIALAAEDAKGSTLLGIVHERILPSSIIYTDEWKGYDGVATCRTRDTSIGASTTPPRFMWLAIFTPTRLRVFGVW
jgi:transposase-like protein